MNYCYSIYFLSSFEQRVQSFFGSRLNSEVRNKLNYLVIVWSASNSLILSTLHLSRGNHFHCLGDFRCTLYTAYASAKNTRTNHLFPSNQYVTFCLNSSITSFKACSISGVSSFSASMRFAISGLLLSI